jgi:hypothetical protein
MMLINDKDTFLIGLVDQSLQKKGTLMHWRDRHTSNIDIGNHSFLSRLGKKESDDNTKKRRRDITVRYWVSNPLLAAEDELITRLRGGKQISGF